MIRTKLLITTLFTTLSLCLCANAETTTPHTAPSSTGSTLNRLCPPVNIIKKNPVTLAWSTIDNRFASKTTSFADSLTQFIGAQWTGVNVGQLTCIYRTSPAHTFPVILIFNTLATTPTGPHWRPAQAGYMNCISPNNDPSDCPFSTQRAPAKQDLYDVRFQPNTPQTEPAS